jgi:hypothetical protein
VAAIVTEATNLAIPFIRHRNSSLPRRFSLSINILYYITLKGDSYFEENKVGL